MPMHPWTNIKISNSQQTINFQMAPVKPSNNCLTPYTRLGYFRVLQVIQSSSNDFLKVDDLLSYKLNNFLKYSHTGTSRT